MNVDLEAVAASLRRAEFMSGVAQLASLPDDQGVEVAFAGRSNAGKSSAINAVTGRRSLARTSKTPGRTREINFFSLDEQRRLVDLPGYGFARVPRNVTQRWAKLIEGYLGSRRSLAGLIVLNDVRRPFTDLDQQLLDWARPEAIPVHVVLTKADKLSRAGADRTLAGTRRRGDVARGEVTVQLFSAKTGKGLDDLIARLGAWLDSAST